MTVSVSIVAAFRTVLLTVETAVGNTHCISHAFDERPYRLAVSIVANTLRLKLESVGELMKQHSSCLKINASRVVIGKRTLHMARAVEYVHIAVAATLCRDTFCVFKLIVQSLQCGNTVFW